MSESGAGSASRAASTPSSPFSSPAASPYALPYLLIALAAFAVFAGTLGAGFVWDDVNLVTTNPRMNSLGNLPGFFTSHLFTEGDARTDYYRPLFLVSLLLDAAAYGISARGFHLSNIFLHVLVSMGVFRFALSLSAYFRGGAAEGRDTVIALTGALLFAVHPMHAEPVAWISGRNEMLYSIFALLSAGFFLRALRNRGRASLLYSVLFYFGALLSKESAITLPAVLVLLAALSPEVSRRRLAWPLLHVLAGAVYFFIRALVLESSAPAGDAPFAERLLTAPWIFSRYITLFAWPFSYRLLHDINYVQSAADGRFWSALAILLVGCAGLVFYFRKLRESVEGRLILFSAGVFAFMIAPVLGILVEIKPVPLAERYAYFPSLGLVLPAALAFAALLDFARARDFAKAVPIPMAALLLVLSVFTWNRASFWRDENVFFQRMIRDAPNFYQGYYNRGRRLHAARNYTGALANFRRAAQLEKNNASVHLNLGVTLHAMGDVSAAEIALLEAARLRPNFYRAYYNLAVLYTRAGRVEDARRNLERVLKLNPGHRGAQNRLKRLNNP